MTIDELRIQIISDIDYLLRKPVNAEGKRVLRTLREFFRMATQATMDEVLTRYKAEQ